MGRVCHRRGDGASSRPHDHAWSITPRHHLPGHPLLPRCYRTLLTCGDEGVQFGHGRRGARGNVGCRRWAEAQPSRRATEAERAIGNAQAIFDRSGTPPIFGANELVEVYAGTISFVGGRAPGEKFGACTAVPASFDNPDLERVHPGIDDFFQPFADVYIVPAGQTFSTNQRLRGCGRCAEFGDRRPRWRLRVRAARHHVPDGTDLGRPLRPRGRRVPERLLRRRRGLRHPRRIPGATATGRSTAGSGRGAVPGGQGASAQAQLEQATPSTS